MGSFAAPGRAVESTMVPVSIAAAEHLHVLAHRAARAARDSDEWWGTPLDTALAAVSLARHSRAHRDVAQAAFERMLRWWQDENPRRISADVAALALTARAAHELQRGDPALTRAAVVAVEDLAGRDRAVIPELHLAIAAWALATITPDRSEAPWPILRSRFDRPQLAGVDEPLRRFGLALSQHPFDANRLVQELLVDIGSAPSLSDAVILLWLISAASDELALALPSSDNALQVLLRRRAELVERLAGEIDERSFVEQEIEDFDVSRDYTPIDLTYLSPFEALLLDLALASRDDAAPWLTYEEARQLFGEQAAAARQELSDARRDHASVLAGLVVIIASLTAATMWLALEALGVRATVQYPASAALGSLLCATAIAVAGRERTLGLVGDAAGSFFIAAALVAAFLVINNAPDKPLVADVNGVASDILLAAGGFLVWAVIVVFVRARRPSPSPG